MHILDPSPGPLLKQSGMDSLLEPHGRKGWFPGQNQSVGQAKTDIHTMDGTRINVQLDL